jgi:hypothetical protein
MRSRVAPPGTTLPAGGAPVDPYYNGTSGAAAPAGTPAAPIVTPVTPPPVDKYSPRGGFNVPQGSIDRTKAIDFAKPNEVKASPTAIARRSLSNPAGGRTQVDTQLTSAKMATPSVDTSSADASMASVSTDAATLATMPAVSRQAALTPLTATPGMSPQADSALADRSPADTALADGDIDSVVANFDGTSRPGTVQSAAIQSNGFQPAKPDLAEPSQSDLDAARSRIARSNSAKAAGGSTIRIRDAAEEAFADDEEPAATTVSDDKTRLRMTAGTPRASFNSNPAAGMPDEEPVVAVAQSQPGQQPAASEPDKGAAQALWLEPADGATDRMATVAATAIASASAPYQYDPSYTSLSGRLEYSASARQWKLRYIPIDGPTDQFGGSVLLSDATRLEGFKPGDFVSVHGAIAAAAQNARGFSPRYDLNQIDPIR